MPSRPPAWRRLDRLALIPGLGALVAMLAEPLSFVFGDAVGYTAFAGGLLLVVGGLGLLFLGAGIVGSVWLVRRVGAATGLVVEPPAPSEDGPAWRVDLPDGAHVVRIGSHAYRPSSLTWDERPIRLVWRTVGRDPQAEFDVAGHRARLVLVPQRSILDRLAPGLDLGVASDEERSPALEVADARVELL